MGALGATGLGAFWGALGSTLIGSAFFAAQGIYQGYQIWTDPRSSSLQRVLGSADILLGVASAYFLRGQVRSQVNEWFNVYAKLPMEMGIQRDLQAIREAFNAGADDVVMDGMKIIFVRDAPPGYLGSTNITYPNEMVLYSHALAQSDGDLMKTIIHENLHNFRFQRGVGGLGISGEDIQGEESVIDILVDQIYGVGKARSWWP